MSKINVFFHTNLDYPGCGTWKFPSEVTCKPNIDEYVKSQDGIQFKICTITHTYDFALQIPVLDIELTKPTYGYI